MEDRTGWYNGYTQKERDENFVELKRRLKSKELNHPAGPCALCGDPHPKNPFEYHNEDYGLNPFLDTEPALLSLCRNCHRDKLHRRFWNHDLWHAFLAHVRRGGYARDLTDDDEVKDEFRKYRAALKRGEAPKLRQLRPYTRVIGSEWFANLRLDEESLNDPSARPRS